MKTKNILLPLLFIIIINCALSQNNENIDEFINWGLKNNLSLSSYIEVSYTEKGKIKFIAKEDIPKKKELLTIPNSIMFNITKLLELLDSKKLNKQYNKFQKLNLTYAPNPYDFRKEESFISYILYLVQKKQKKYKKSKFYEFFEKFLKSLNKYVVNSPLYFEQSQIDFLAGSLLSRSIDIMKKVYDDEIKILSDKSYYNNYIDSDDYIHFRFPVHNRGLNISNQWTLVPFINIIEQDYTSYNANYTIQDNGDVKIISRREIKKGDEIVLKAPKQTNVRRFLNEGKTNEKLVNYFDSYYISVFGPGIYYLYKLKDEKFKNYYIDLLQKDFDSKATSLYFQFAEELQGDGTDTWAYDVLNKNLQYYKEYFERITLSEIYENFKDKDDRINIERIIRGEKRVIEKAIKHIYKTINQFMEIQTKYMSDDNNGNNKPEENDSDL
jgi:hypothetical protein